MALTLIIANKTYSSWSMRPWLLLRHFEIGFDEVVIPMDRPATRAEMLRHAPTGKCPALRDGEVAVWDSLAIVEYLAERHPDLPIWPVDRAARATARSIAAEMHAGFATLRTAMPMNTRRVPPRPLRDVGGSAETQDQLRGEVARVEAAWRDARTLFAGGGAFLFGAFSAADAMFAPVVSRLRTYAVPVAADTRAYMEAIAALPAWRDWHAEAEAEGWHRPQTDDL